jgi:hypothetical protein
MHGAAFWETAPVQSATAPKLRQSQHCTPKHSVGQVHPPASDFDVGLIDMPFWINHPLETAEQLQQFRRVTDGLPVNGRVINGDAVLDHHLLQVTQVQAVSQVPSDAQQDYRAVEMAAFEHDAPSEPARGVG